MPAVSLGSRRRRETDVLEHVSKRSIQTDVRIQPANPVEEGRWLNGAHPVLAGSFAAKTMRTSSAKLPASIFSMTRAR